MENKEHVLMLFVGKTGAGKSRLINELCERNNWTQLISYATRPRRNDNDNDHHFVTMDDYLLAKSNGEIVAETEISGNVYYATKGQLYEADFYTIDPNGLEYLLSMNLTGIRFVIVYITCPDDLREQRATGQRGDDRQVYRERNRNERNQFRRFIADEKWDYSVKNVSFAETYSVLKWICDVKQLWKNHQEDTTE